MHFVFDIQQQELQTLFSANSHKPDASPDEHGNGFDHPPFKEESSLSDVLRQESVTRHFEFYPSFNQVDVPKHNAFSYYRQRTGAGEEAARAVENEYTNKDSISRRFGKYCPPIAAFKSDEFRKILFGFYENNEKLNAMKLYRQQTDLGFAEAYTVITQYFDSEFMKLRPEKNGYKKITASSNIFAALKYDGTVFVRVKEESPEEWLRTEEHQGRHRTQSVCAAFAQQVAAWKDVIDIGADNTCLYAVTTQGKLLAVALFDDYSGFKQGWKQTSDALRIIEIPTNFFQNILVINQKYEYIRFRVAQINLTKNFAKILQHEENYPAWQQAVTYKSGLHGFGFFRVKTVSRQSITHSIDFDVFQADHILKITDVSTAFADKAWIALSSNCRLRYYTSPESDKAFIAKIAEIETWESVYDFAYDFVNECVIGITENGKLLCTAGCPYRNEISHWNDVKKVLINREDNDFSNANNPTRIVALRTDGSVYAAGNAIQSKQIQKWTNVKSIAIFNNKIYAVDKQGNLLETI